MNISSYGFTAADIGTNVIIAAQGPGTNTLVTIGADSILLAGVNVAAITATDFIFA
jgi:hypothetical protein